MDHFKWICWLKKKQCVRVFLSIYFVILFPGNPIFHSKILLPIKTNKQSQLNKSALTTPPVLTTGSAVRAELFYWDKLHSFEIIYRFAIAPIRYLTPIRPWMTNWIWLVLFFRIRIAFFTFDIHILYIPIKTYFDHFNNLILTSNDQTTSKYRIVIKFCTPTHHKMFSDYSKK